MATTKRSSESHGIRTYLGRILRDEAPGTSISHQAMDCTNSLMVLTIERLVKAAMAIAQRVGNVTISEDDLRVAAEIILPESLRSGAIQAGDNALRNYQREPSAGVMSPQSNRNSRTTRGSRGPSTSVSSPGSLSASQAGRRAPVRRAASASLIMAPPRVEASIRSTMQRYPRTVSRVDGQVASIERLSENASVFLAGVIEYLSRELFRVGSACTTQAGRRLMRDIELIAGLQRSGPLSELAGSSFLARYSHPTGSVEEESLDTSQA